MCCLSIRMCVCVCVMSVCPCICVWCPSVRVCVYDVRLSVYVCDVRLSVYVCMCPSIRAYVCVEVSECWGMMTDLCIWFHCIWFYCTWYDDFCMYYFCFLPIDTISHQRSIGTRMYSTIQHNTALYCTILHYTKYVRSYVQPKCTYSRVRIKEHHCCLWDLLKVDRAALGVSWHGWKDWLTALWKIQVKDLIYFILFFFSFLLFCFIVFYFIWDVKESREKWEKEL